MTAPPRPPERPEPDDVLAFERTKAECSAHGPDCRGVICSIIRHTDRLAARLADAEAALEKIVGGVPPEFENDQGLQNAWRRGVAFNALAAAREHGGREGE